ncbi:MAG: hypothetical protein ACOH5I_07890 [Oligoflexus sp.]
MNYKSISKTFGLWLIILFSIQACSAGLSPLSSGIERGSTQSSDQDPIKSSLSSDKVPITAEPETQASAGKASDDDEGIPGYFREIGAVQTETTNEGQILITAPPETLTKLTTQIFLNVWLVDRSHFSENRRWINAEGRTSATQIGSVMANMDGSFRFEVDFPIEERDALIIAVDDSPQPMTMDFIVDDFAIFGGFSLERAGNNSTRPAMNGLLTSNVERMQETIGQDLTAQILAQDFATSREQKTRRRHH